MSIGNRPRKNVLEYPAFFYSLKETIWTGFVLPVMSLFAVFITLYFICQKSSHRFLSIFLSVTEDIVVIEVMK